MAKQSKNVAYNSKKREENPEMRGGICACLWHRNPNPPFSERWFMKAYGLGFQTGNMAEKYP